MYHFFTSEIKSIRFFIHSSAELKIKIVILIIWIVTDAVFPHTNSLLAVLEMHDDATARALTYPHPDPLAQSTLCAAAGGAAPASPTSPGGGRSGSGHWSGHWPLTAVVLLVVIQPELLTVV